MEGESEYSFWHLLVRDVAYSQIPRAERARRHRAAAAWIERQGSERIEDLAELLAHHYLQALELAAAAGDREQAAELTAPARRFLALAGERALGLDTVQAEARLARALELTPADDPERPDLLVRWADAASQAGRPREAAEAIDEALATLRARGETEAVARAQLLRSHVAFSLGEGGEVALAAETVVLLAQEPPGPELVAAQAALAGRHFLAGAYAEAIGAADRARELAKTLGLPEPALALNYRGYSRALLGDADGLAEMERALALLLEQGAGQDAGSLQNDLAIARYPLEGPARSLAAFEQAIAFCEQRGLAHMVAYIESDCPGLLVELGRPEQALERAHRLALALEASGATHPLVWIRAFELATHLARGESEAAPGIVDWLVETVHADPSPAVIVEAFVACAAARLAAGLHEQARALLAEIEQTAGVRETTYYVRELPAMLRTALAAGDPALAKRLADALEPRYPLNEHALCAARAQLAETAGEQAEAAELYAEAARRWQQFGNVPERAYALLGRGRCLSGLGKPEAGESLREARELFSSIGYKPALAQTETLLEQTIAADS
jgi:hypothetical protein